MPVLAIPLLDTLQLHVSNMRAPALMPEAETAWVFLLQGQAGAPGCGKRPILPPQLQYAAPW